ncbi:8-amino-7-oxononanoate synthase [Aestuariibacter halophilus]|uniref:8-amino-7-oxononanoate synthase n=1 Tax=Fluctibacter halophilus TaxID=226011 RepID=A0ABS8G658_9ALTE|nr:8-amino-7-oxononanoate synthase [Aestuariibacter halophilus]MCC2616079.1 8-amino-7-oxononanoate synthase [Aestuariibacter halophilus]
MAFAHLQSALDKRAADGLLRQRHCVQSSAGALLYVDNIPYLNFASNDYLGMRQSPEVLEAWLKGMSQYGAGSGASALVCGYTEAHHALEQHLASALNRDAVVVFGSGCAANQAICHVLGHKDSLLLADKYMHASFIDGALSSEAQFSRFAHNDMADLKRRLSGAPQDTLIASESVFSMDGDEAPVNELVALAKAHEHWLMLDDAHGFGVLGENGLGVVEAYNLSQADVPVVMGTFGKAIGTAGAFIAGSQTVIDSLINFARHYVYSTAIPPAQAMATLASIQSDDARQRRQQLASNVSLFRHLADEHNLSLMPSGSAIQPLVLGSNDRVMQASARLRELGLWVVGMRSPTVPKGTERLRITLSASHQTRDIEALVDALVVALPKGSPL